MAPSDNLGKSNPGLQLRLSKDIESQVLDEGERDALLKSRQKLEEKARLYDKLVLEPGDNIDEDDDTYMVDFQRKSLNKFPIQTKTEDTFSSAHPSDDWVDYTDSLGRSRKCLRKDLPKMIEMDMNLQENRQSGLPPTGAANNHVPLRNDGRPEFNVTEKESEAWIPDVPTGPVHYQNVQFSEIRSHGTGYFAFSQSEAERKEQMVTLNALRDQTKDQRLRSEKMKEKRKLMLAARLAKVKQRKKLSGGANLSDSNSNSGSEDDSIVEPAKEHIEKAEAVKTDKASDDPPAPVRPWDRGKVGVPKFTLSFKKASQKQWVEEERERRPAEFAPPQLYYGSDLAEGVHQNQDKRTSEFAPPKSYYADDRVEDVHQFFKAQASENSRQVPTASSSQSGSMWTVPPPNYATTWTPPPFRTAPPPQYPAPPHHGINEGLANSWPPPYSGPPTAIPNNAHSDEKFDLSNVPLPPTISGSNSV